MRSYVDGILYLTWLPVLIPCDATLALRPFSVSTQADDAPRTVQQHALAGASITVRLDGNNTKRFKVYNLTWYIDMGFFTLHLCSIVALIVYVKSRGQVSAKSVPRGWRFAPLHGRAG